MAEKYPAHGSSADGKPVVGSPGLSSNEPSPSGTSALQPYFQSRVPAPSNQSSIVVPVRLDVLLFLLNSAARGAQYALPHESLQGGQGSLSTCHHSPAAQHVPNSCGCPSACHSINQPSQYGGDHGRCVGVMESRESRQGSFGSGHQRDGKSGPCASATGGWKRPQSPMGWQEKPQGEGRGRDNRGNWEGRRQGFGRSWGDRRQSAGDSASWRSGSQDWRREGSAFGSNYTSNKRAQEGRLRPPWDAPDAKRPMDNAKVGWLNSQGTKESTGLLDRPAALGRGKPAVQENSEDWETDYERELTSSTPGTVPSSSSSGVPADLSKEDDGGSAADPSEPRASTSRLPELAFKAQAVPAAEGKPPVTSCSDQSKNGGFVTYLKNLYSYLPKKPSSEGSSDLVIDTDVESSKPEEEEDESPENEAGEGSEAAREEKTDSV